MNESPYSNHEINVLFEHGIELKILKKLLCSSDISRKVLQLRLIITSAFMSVKTLLLHYDGVMVFECFTLTPFYLQKISTGKW